MVVARATRSQQVSTCRADWPRRTEKKVVRSTGGRWRNLSSGLHYLFLSSGHDRFTPNKRGELHSTSGIPHFRFVCFFPRPLRQCPRIRYIYLQKKDGVVWVVLKTSCRFAFFFVPAFVHPSGPGTADVYILFERRRKRALIDQPRDASEQHFVIGCVLYRELPRRSTNNRCRSSVQVMTERLCFG